MDLTAQLQSARCLYDQGHRTQVGARLAGKKRMAFRLKTCLKYVEDRDVVSDADDQLI